MRNNIIDKKNWVLLFILIIFRSNCYGQSNSLFSPNNSKWSQTQGYWTPIIGGGIIYHRYPSSWILRGDTIFNNNIYQKVYYAGNTQGKIDTACYSFSKYILNDNNKIYAGTSLDTMILEYDFNLIKGDSFAIIGSINTSPPSTKIYYPKVDSINTVFYAGKWRKYIRFSLLPYNTRISWLEGVGDVSFGLLVDYRSIMTFNLFGTPLNGFSCFYDAGSLSFSGNCMYQNCLITNLKKDELSDMILIYPNPITNREFFVNTPFQIDRIILTDVLGNGLKLDFKTISEGYKVFIPNYFKSGIYNLTIESKNGVINKKIVIELP